MAPTGVAPALSVDDRRVLLDAAIDAIGSRLLETPPTELDPGASLQVREDAASFVTLRRGEQLLGCIGSLEPTRPLHLDVRQNAAAAAFDDPRLPPVTASDFAVMSIKVSVLSPLEPMHVSGYHELTRALRSRHEGVLVVARGRRGTFLPSVWDQLPDSAAFVAALWQKAGLAARNWPDDLRLWRYQTYEFAEDGPRSHATVKPDAQRGND